MYANCNCSPHHKEPHKVKSASCEYKEFYVPLFKKKLVNRGMSNNKILTPYFRHLYLGTLFWNVGDELSCNDEKIKTLLNIRYYPHWKVVWKSKDGDVK